MSKAAPRAWQLVFEKIERDLIDRRLEPGDRVASERDLADQLGVGRSSVREALRVLEVLGLLRTATGSGPTAGAVIVSTPAAAVETLLRLQVAACGFRVDDVVKTRLLLESGVVATLAAERRGVGQAAMQALDAMDATDLDVTEFLALDAQFHLALAEASGNAIVATVMNGLRTSIESYVRVGALLIPDWNDTRARLREEHHSIAAAIIAGDADLARELVSAHIAGYYRQIRLADIV